jgi:hypothetical protein
MDKSKSFINNIKNKEILIISNDAGGAEVLSSFVKKFKISAKFLLSGPAKDIFVNKLKNNFKKDKIVKKLYHAQFIITGTSLKNNMEHNAIKYAKNNNIKSASFLDHWVNYEERFIRRRILLLPDYILVGDKNAFKEAKKVFKKKIILIKNPYLESIKKIKNYKKKNCSSLLFFSSNIDSYNKLKNISDYSVLNNFIIEIKKNKIFRSIKKIILRKHPSEDFNKYVNFKNGFSDLKIEIDKNLDLKDSLIKNIKYVAGYDSMALVVSKLSGKTTINLCQLEESKIPKKFIDYYISLESLRRNLK